ncbi:MAG: hypothetical protein M3457_08440 [Chloroflexota bacterium]|nr:hypothetical protein [Chloroflexota bacterium]
MAGTRLKLEMAPALEAIRLWCGQPDTGTPTVLARTDLFRVTEVLADEGQGEVRFRTAEPNPTELLITEDATFQMSVGVMIDERAGEERSPPRKTLRGQLKHSELQMTTG